MLRNDARNGGNDGIKSPNTKTPKGISSTRHCIEAKNSLRNFSKTVVLKSINTEILEVTFDALIIDCLMITYDQFLLKFCSESTPA